MAFPSRDVFGSLVTAYGGGHESAIGPDGTGVGSGARLSEHPFACSHRMGRLRRRAVAGWGIVVGGECEAAVRCSRNGTGAAARKVCVSGNEHECSFR